MKAKNQVLQVWGELACFTRPEMKVERFSYPFITPSAARGIFDAIYCKPTEFRWQITKIEIFGPPEYIALRRNEVKEVISVKMVTGYMAEDKEIEPIWADGDAGSNYYGADQKGRTQRQTMALKDVKYRLHAHIVPWPDFENRIQALENQFRRRAAKGKCIYQPYFGCREFPAYFELIAPDAPPAIPAHINNDNIGWMLYDVFDLSSRFHPDDWKKQNHNLSISLFKPIVENGIVDVPPYESDDVFKPQRGGS